MKRKRKYRIVLVDIGQGETLSQYHRRFSSFDEAIRRTHALNQQLDRERYPDVLWDVTAE